MKRTLRAILGLSLIPVGAMVMNACAPIEAEDAGLNLDEASDNYIWVGGQPSEYGHCWDGWDNNGNGLIDSEDYDCHILGPINDLSLFAFPQGHNFFPDVSKVPITGPGFAGGFRDRPQTTRWFRFLTEPDGYVAGYDLFAPGVNHAVAPVPMPLVPKIRQGTAAHGNNNNVFLYGVNPVAATPGAAFAPGVLGMPPGASAGWPGTLYNGGSQGPTMKKRARGDRF